MKTHQRAKLIAKIDKALARGWAPGRGSVASFARKGRPSARRAH